ncbi:MAG: DUF1761 domain-containing protein [Candidatus Moranbacteria bacterium]|nr:DUF1761 domain-containing protein [bacterium]MDP1833997.1 DUF1761 domain-containing protein [Candidatus Moranbacteria bacterium]
MEFFKLTLLPIFLAAGAGMAGSFLWYALFLKKDGRTAKEELAGEKPAKSWKSLSQASFLANFFSAAAASMLLDIFQAKTFFQGSKIALAVFFFLTAVSGIKKVVIENKSMENFMLGAGHNLVNIGIIFSILILAGR